MEAPLSGPLNNEDEAKKAATWEFVKFLVVSPESQAYWNAQTGYFPVTVKAHEEPVFRENLEKYPQFGTAIDQLHDSARSQQVPCSAYFLRQGRWLKRR